ncbi:ESPR-type extended signal peptide-containing protein [Paraburkholderia tropica]|uniref:ESPR-type extended signal peptide-containing protein n=2 Tax=Paraburkholderia tropica TaxID=92647 RepID=UPI002ABE3D2F|nr:ESPR-type extended signal peptide-containing protein [Paraburkholderia tropica]
MNKAYRSVWNESAGAWVAVQENARSHGSGGVKAGVVNAAQAVALLGLGGIALAANAADAQPEGATALLGMAANEQAARGSENANISSNFGALAPAGTSDVQNALLLASLGVQGTGAAALAAASSSAPASPVEMAAAAPQGASLMATAANSGVDTTGLTTAFRTAAWYAQVRGIANASGSTGPTDMARANGAGSIAMGSNTQSDGNASLALGIQSRAMGNDSVALGAGSVANQANTVSVGSDGTQTHVVYDADNVATTLPSLANTRRIVNMAAGQSDTDAVNVAQLKGVTSALGGGAGVGGDGSVMAPSYVLGNQTYGDVGTALKAVESTAITGSVDGVKYDTSAHTRITFDSADAGTVLSNVANGKADRDAINLGQLKAAGLDVDGNGNATNSFVAYDDTSRATVTLGGASGTRITNLVAGNVAAGSSDAVNGAQLYGVASGTAKALGGGAGVNADGSLSGPGYVLGGSTYSDVGTALKAVENTAASGPVDGVKYDTPAHARVTFDGGDAGTVLSNVAKGTADRDAVNLGQLKAAGLDVDGNGNATNSFVAYDDTSRGTVTLGGASGTRITNLVAGNVAAGSSDAVNGAQLYGVSSSTATALGGGAGVNADGSVSGPRYVLGGTTYSDVGTALKAVESSAAAGPVDGVKYDTPAHQRVTFDGGEAGTVLSNVAKGTADRDAVNLGQLKAAGLDVDGNGNATNSFVAYDDTSRGTVTLGGANGTKITNLAAGSASGDAVNAGQLRALAGTLGGGAGLASDGSILAPSYHMQGGTQTTVGSALDTLDTGLNSLQQKISDSGLDLVTQDATSRAIKVGAGTNGTVVNFAGTAGNRTLTGVAAGAVNAASADAVNGAQLYASVAHAAAALGGGASVSADGTLAAPSYTIGGTTLNNVGSALTNLDGRVTQNTTDITNLQKSVTNMAGSVANAVQYDSSAHDSVTLGGTGEAVKLSNLADAVLSANSTDAVTGSQLFATNMQVASIEQAVQNVAASASIYVAANSPNGAATASGSNTLAAGGGAVASGTASTAIGDQAHATGTNAVALGANSVADRANSVSVGSIGNERQITNVANGTAPTDAVNLGQLNSAFSGVNSRIDDVDRDARRGIAAASALNVVTPYLPGRTTMNAGVAAYRGQAALGIGVSRWNEKGSVNYNLGVSSAGGNSTIVRAGLGIVFGG